jgi:hypothetical protein
MAKGSIKSRLGASMKAETESVRSRFERADAVMGKPDKPARATAAIATAPDVPAKVIRDSFTMPSEDYDLIAAVKQRCLKAGVSVTKSEVLRAGLNALNAMPDKDLKAVVESLSKVKTGRPSARNEAEWDS